MPPSLQDKLTRLRQRLHAVDALCVAFSGGVDSAFLAAMAQSELGGKCLAVTVRSPVFPEFERRQAAALAEHLGLTHVFLDLDVLSLPGFARNPPDRCYLCKRGLLRAIRSVAEARGIPAIADGSNVDDLDDFRPGRKALEEQGVLSPLLEAGFTKADIREQSRTLGLPTADHPAFACLASRIPPGEIITRAKLEAVERMEESLRDRGFRQFRARHHGTVVRIEVDEDEISRLMNSDERKILQTAAKKAGFRHVAVDLAGYRTGSLNS